MPLKEWLETKIWPVEAHLTEEDVYWGVKLACLEMIKTGTTFFNDMYWHWRGTARAVQEMGIRAAVSAVFIDTFREDKMREQFALNEKLFAESAGLRPQGDLHPGSSCDLHRIGGGAAVVCGFRPGKGGSHSLPPLREPRKRWRDV